LWWCNFKNKFKGPDEKSKCYILPVQTPTAVAGVRG
jgi:hypothetical protein|tara:strand:- start:62071 stop:62178 length:108 start_codon:yes stop_codon:yes gene_type:complete